MLLASRLKIVSLIILIVLVFQVICIYPTFAEPPKPQEDPEYELYPSISDMFGGKNTSPYLNSYRPNYYFDLKKMGFFKNLGNFDDNMWNGLANLLFLLQKGIAYVVIVIVYFSYEIDFINSSSPENPFGLGFGDILTTITKNLKASIFDELMLVMIVLLGLFYAVKMVKDQKTQVWIAIIQTVVIIALALGFFQQPKTMLNAIDEASKGLSQSILVGTYKANNKDATPTSATMMACNDIWVMFVHKPWQILEFGSVAAAEKYEQQLLILPPDSEERQALISDIYDENNNLFSPIWGIKRLGAIILSIIPVLVMAAIIAVICLLKLGYSFLVILIAVFGVLVFVMALVPWWGFRALQSWVSKLIGYGCTGVIISFMIALIFTFMDMLYDLSDKLGWFLVILLQLLIIAMIIWKRDKIFDFITNFRTAVQHGPNAVNKQLRRDINLESKLAGTVRSSTDKRQQEEAYSRNSRKSRNALTDEVIKPKSLKDIDEASSNNRPKANRILYNMGIGDKPETEYYSDEKSVDNLVNMMDTAKSILERRFTAEKEMEDYKAKIEKREPRYSDFIKNAMNKGAEESKFENKDIFSVIKEMREASINGQKLEDLYPKEANKPSKQEILQQLEEREEEEQQREEYEWFVSSLKGVSIDDAPLKGEKESKPGNGSKNAEKPADAKDESDVKTEAVKNNRQKKEISKDGQPSHKSTKDDLHFDDNRHRPSNEVSKDYKTLLRLAEEILEKQYENERLEAEQKAERTGKQPEYSYFVQAAMSKEKMNLPKFDDRQKLAVANDLKRIYSTGGSIDSIRSSTGSREIRRPNNVVEFTMKNDISEPQGTSLNTISIADISKELTKEFNSDYGKQYDNKFMQNLIAKYGESSVRSVLDKMKDVQLRDNRINNPAGYITEALKNNVRDKVK